MKNESLIPNLLVSDGSGNLFEIPELKMVGMALDSYVLPEKSELIELPEGSDLFELPNRRPVGYDPLNNEFVELQEYQGEKVFATAAFMAPAYVQLYRSAYSTEPGAEMLPLYAYTSVGWQDGQFYVTGQRIDPDPRQDARNFNLELIEQNARRMVKKYPQNRLVCHLIENCVLRYGCPAARNLVMERWECPIPTSPACNANCVGCISKQHAKSGVCASQERINFIPTTEEIVEFTVPHLENAPRAVVSFGQGCEGEPLTNSELLLESVKEIRKKTSRGIINLNTNASYPDIIDKLFEAGLDSIRVSLNSAQKTMYQLYYQPKDYAFEDVIESLKVASQPNRWTSLNYFIFPGFTDHASEMEQFQKLLNEVKINLIQARNLNMDPEWYMDTLMLDGLDDDWIGIQSWITTIKKKFPEIKFGYFNPPKEAMR